MLAGAVSAPLPEIAFELLAEAGLPQAMVELLDPAEAGTTIWQPAQLEELRSRAMALLSNLSVVCPEELAPLGRLAPTLLSYLTMSAETGLREGALHVLVDALPVSPPLQQAIGKAGAVQQILNMVSSVAMGGGALRGSITPFSRFTTLTTCALKVPSGLSAAAMQDAILALSLLCAGDAPDAPEFTATFGEHGGVAVLLPLLQPHTDPKLLLSAIDCLWNAVVGSASNTARLVERDGILQLLDCLEATSFAPRAQLLSALADLLADTRAAAQCQEWHGKKRQCAVQLLLELWHEEEARLGMATGGAQLRSTQRPLTTGCAPELASLNQTLQMTNEEEEEALDELAGGHHDPLAADAEANAAALAGGLPLTTLMQLTMAGRFHGLGTAASAVLESFDMRSKVYAVLAALNFEASLPLTTEESMLMTAAKRYVAFVAAEEWQNVQEELQGDGVRPITPDAATLATHLSVNTEEAAKVLQQQTIMGESITQGLAKGEVAMLSRVRVLRDGPMGQVVKSKGRSMFRARIEAKAKVGDMVAKSKVGYRGPLPTTEEYADATLLKLEGSIRGTKDEDDNEPPPAVLPPVAFELKHVPQALTALTAASGMDPARMNPYLASRGIGLLSTGKAAKQVAALTLTMDGGSPGLGVHALEHSESKPIKREDLRELCLDYIKDGPHA